MHIHFKFPRARFSRMIMHKGDMCYLKKKKHTITANFSKKAVEELHDRQCWCTGHCKIEAVTFRLLWDEGLPEAFVKNLS